MASSWSMARVRSPSGSLTVCLRVKSELESSETVGRVAAWMQRSIEDDAERVPASPVVPVLPRSISSWFRELAKVPGAEPDRIGPSRDGPLHRLADPPGRVSGQLRLVRQIKPVDRLQEAAEALLEQVGVGDPPVAEPLGGMRDKPHVGQRELAAELGVAAEDGTKTNLGRSTTHGQRRDVLGQALWVVGPLDVGPLDPGQCLGELPLALGQATEQFALLLRRQDPSLGAVQVHELTHILRHPNGTHCLPNPLGASFRSDVTDK